MPSLPGKVIAVHLIKVETVLAYRSSSASPRFLPCPLYQAAISQMSMEATTASLSLACVPRRYPQDSSETEYVSVFSVLFPLFDLFADKLKAYRGFEQVTPKSSQIAFAIPVVTKDFTTAAFVGIAFSSSRRVRI